MLVRIIRLYQRYVSPWFAPSCRYYPTCSEYAADAISVHGPIRGVWLAIKRVGRCHPLHAGGDDPVPERQDAPNTINSTSASPVATAQDSITHSDTQP